MDLLSFKGKCCKEIMFQGPVVQSIVSLTNSLMTYSLGSKMDLLSFKGKCCKEKRFQGPVVQSIVSLINSLMTYLLTVVTKLFSNTLILMLKKM